MCGLSNSEVWAAVSAFAETWRISPIVRRFASQLPRNTRPSHGVPKQLQEVEAGYHIVGSRPLRLGNLLAIVDTVDLTTPDMQAFQRDALVVEYAAHTTVAWIRAQLPGYPMMPAPQLVNDSGRTTREFSWGLPWLREHLAAGLQFNSVPPGAAAQLQVEDPSGFEQRARSLLQALAATEKWNAFVASHNALRPDDRDQLRHARSALIEDMKPERVSAYEPRYALRRAEYRDAHTAAAKEGLTGMAREYADAFDGIDGLIDHVGSEVLGQLVAYGPQAC